MAISSSIAMNREQKECLEAALEERMKTDPDNREEYQHVLKQFDYVPSDVRFMSLPLFETENQYKCTMDALLTSNYAKENSRIAEELAKRIESMVVGVPI